MEQQGIHHSCYRDQHFYCRMHPDLKKKVKHVPLRDFPLRDKYPCFLWQLYPHDTKKLTQFIDNNHRLENIKSQSMIEGASQADILILSSGSGIYHVDSFLASLDTSAKIVIIASIRDAVSVQQDIKHRIDFHLHKLHLFEQFQFDNFVDHALDNSRGTDT